MYFDARYLCLILCLIGFSYSQVVAAENAAKTTQKQPTEAHPRHGWNISV